MASYKLLPPVSSRPGPVFAGDPSDKQIDRVLLGSLAEGGQRRQLWLDISGEQVVGVLGKRGTGKSYTLGVLIEGLAGGAAETAIARHKTARGGLVFDIMDIFWSTQIPLSMSGSAEIKKQHAAMVRGGMKPQDLAVDVWIPAGFEDPEIDPRGVRTIRIDPAALSIDDWGALFDINIYSEPQGMLIADLISHVCESGYETRDHPPILANTTYNLDDLLDCLDAAAFVANFSDSTVRAVRQRLQSFARLELFRGAPTPLSKLISAGRVSILMLSRVPDQIKRVVVSVLLNQILRQRSAASFAQKRLDLQSDLSDGERRKLKNAIATRIPRTWVLMDEAHVLAGTGEGSVARDAIIKYAKEGRNFGLSLAVATQQPSALDSRLMSQVETMIVHQLTASKDAAVAAENLKSPSPESMKVDDVLSDMRGLLRRLSQGEAVFSCGNAPQLPRSCVLAVRPRISAHGGYEA